MYYLNGIYTKLFFLPLITLVQSAEPMVYHITEPGSPGDFVGNLVTDSFISQNYSGEVIRTLRFELLDQGPRQSLFDLNESTGILKLGAENSIDREQICPRLETCEVELDITLLPRKYFQIIKVTVIIDDINDYAPLFPRSNVTYSVSETTPPGVLFPLITATDLDSPEYGLQGYALHGDSAKFGLQMNRIDDEIDVRLTLLERLDREEQSYYELRLTASDGGRPPLEGSQDILIRVLDANDNSPQFARSSIELRVKENKQPNTALDRVQARDRDDGENGNIRYSLEQKTDNLYGDIFRVDPATGDIALIGELDYEKQSLYRLKIIAQDNGEFPLSATATVVVNVEDVNDMRPVISVNSIPRPPTDTAFVRILEHEPALSMVALISVEDGDSLENAHVVCELRGTDKEDFKLEPILENEYKLVTNIELDREIQSQYYLDVYCEDHGDPFLEQVVNLRIEVTDINDHRPTFPTHEYIFVLEENNNLNEFIGTVSASDDDHQNNAKVRYQFCDGGTSESEIATLDERTGVLTARAYFDRELKDRYEFCIRASDSGSPPLTSTVDVIVSIADEDDNKPVFNHSAYVFYVKENQPMDTFVGRVHAYDNDLPPNNEFSFAFNNGDNRHFKIDFKTGVITTRESLDRESRDTYDVIVLVQSSSYPTFDMCKVTIRVEDMNDCTPIIHFPKACNGSNEAACTIEISNKVPIGYEIAKIFASDNDLGNNSVLTYTVSGERKGLFTLNPHTGRMFTAKTLEQIDLEICPLTIQVADGGVVPKISMASLRIIVNSSLQCCFPSRAQSSFAGHPDIQLLLIAGGAALVFILLVVILVVFCAILIKKARKPGKEYYIAGQNEEADDQKPARHENGSLKRNYDIDDEYEGEEMIRVMTLSQDTEEEVEPIPPPSNYGSMTSMPNHNDINGSTYGYESSNGSPSCHALNPWVPITTRPQYHTSPRPRDSPGNVSAHPPRHVTFTPISERDEIIIPRNQWEMSHSGSGTFV